jgi:hypothetical protein
MKKKAILFVLVIVLLFSHVLCINAQEVKTFYTGNKYLEFPVLVKCAYVAGLVDMKGIHWGQVLNYQFLLKMKLPLT